MGRKYTGVTVCSDTKCINGIKAFVDTGADLTIIGTKLAKKLKVKKSRIDIAWIASNGSEVISPIGSIKIKADDDKVMVLLEDVLIEDAPLDTDSAEQVILGLDYLQKAKKALIFDD